MLLNPKIHLYGVLMRVNRAYGCKIENIEVEVRFDPPSP